MAGIVLSNVDSAVDVGNAPARQNHYAIASNIAPQYQLVLRVDGDEGLVRGKKVFPLVAALPERYNISVSSQWDSPFANKSISESLGAGTSSATIDGLMSGLGIGTRNKMQLAQVWQSTSPITFNVDLVFNAVTNTQLDIMYKHLGLLKLVCPAEAVGFGINTGVLVAPGPTVLGGAIGGRNITLQLGMYLRMENVIVKSVSSDIQTICGADGIPHSMTINVEFETFFSGVTTDDLESFFIA